MWYAHKMPPQENLPNCLGGCDLHDEGNCSPCAAGRLNGAFEDDDTKQGTKLQPVSLQAKPQPPDYLQHPTSLNAEKLPPHPGEESLMDFDDLLPYIGEFGIYQKLLFVFMIPFAFFVAFVYFSQIFMSLTPEHHWCQVPELINANLTVEQR